MYEMVKCPDIESDTEYSTIIKTINTDNDIIYGTNVKGIVTYYILER